MIWLAICVWVLISAGFAVCVSDVKRAALALWMTGLGVGALFLGLGAETLGIAQWILSTLIAITFVFYSVMFGEYEGAQRELPRLPWLAWAATISLGAGFVAVLWFASRHLDLFAGLTAAQVDRGALVALGRSIIENHLISLELLGLTLFLVMVGVGVVARPEPVGSREEKK